MKFFRYDGTPTLLGQRILDLGFTNEDVSAIAVAVDSVCPECGDEEEPCHCWNDE